MKSQISLLTKDVRFILIILTIDNSEKRPRRATNGQCYGKGFFAILYASLNVKVYQYEADHAYYKALTDRRFPSCYVTSKKMFQLANFKTVL